MNTEFAAEHNLEVSVTPEEWPSFWFRKPASDVFIHGPNARINIGSIDRSINIA